MASGATERTWNAAGRRPKCIRSPDFEKENSKLIFENEGTGPQAGALNATYSGWRGAIMVALNELMCWEQYYAVGGALRHVEFNPTRGTLNAPTSLPRFRGPR